MLLLTMLWASFLGFSIVVHVVGAVVVVSVVFVVYVMIVDCLSMLL